MAFLESVEVGLIIYSSIGFTIFLGILTVLVSIFDSDSEYDDLDPANPQYRILTAMITKKGIILSIGFPFLYSLSAIFGMVNLLLWEQSKFVDYHLIFLIFITVSASIWFIYLIIRPFTFTRREVVELRQVKEQTESSIDD